MEPLDVVPDDIDPPLFFFMFGFAAVWLPVIGPFDICPFDIDPFDIWPLGIDPLDICPLDICPLDIWPLDIWPEALGLVDDCAKLVPAKTAPRINAAPAMVALRSMTVLPSRIAASSRLTPYSRKWWGKLQTIGACSNPLRGASFPGSFSEEEPVVTKYSLGSRPAPLWSRECCCTLIAFARFAARH